MYDMFIEIGFIVPMIFLIGILAMACLMGAGSQTETKEEKPVKTIDDIDLSLANLVMKD